MDKIFFNGWENILRTLLIGVLAYGILIVQLRMSGKRTLSKMNAFDFIVTIALGSTLATILLSKDVALAEGTVAFATLILLQFVITWLSVRSKAVSKLIKDQPVLLLYQGAFLPDAMQKARITKEEILASLRNQGISSVAEVGAVVLETEGTLSVIQHLNSLDSDVLENVKRPDSLRES